jgi:hypothetical protein
VFRTSSAFQKVALCRRFEEWAIQDSNLGPLPYQAFAVLAAAHDCIPFCRRNARCGARSVGFTGAVS